VLVEELARGGMAEVFRALLTGPQGFSKVVALKRMLPALDGDAELVERFIAEARTASDLTHSNIVHLYELGEIEGRYYLASELVDGMDCERLLELARGFVSLTEAAAFIVAEAARGLAYAHAATRDGRPLNLVHRDVSPQNILVSFTGEVKITDFGIARVRTEYQRKTGTGLLLGKLRYLSPEQVAGLEIDGRSDIFALGLVLWELLVGRPLITGANPSEVVQELKRGSFPPPSVLRREVPVELDLIVAQALSRDRGRRYQTADELARDLDRFLQARGGFGRDELAALLATLAPRCKRAAAPADPIVLPPRRRRLPRWLAPACALAVLVVGVTSLRIEVRTRAPDAEAAAPPAVKPESLKLCEAGERLLAAGDPAAAADLYRKALALDPSAALAHLGLGKCAAILGDKVLAIASFRAFLAVEPDGPAADSARRWLTSLGVP
jgi:hypothetical protein